MVKPQRPHTHKSHRSHKARLEKQKRKTFPKNSLPCGNDRFPISRYGIATTYLSLGFGAVLRAWQIDQCRESNEDLEISWLGMSHFANFGGFGESLILGHLYSFVTRRSTRNQLAVIILRYSSLNQFVNQARRIRGKVTEPPHLRTSSKLNASHDKTPSEAR